MGGRERGKNEREKNEKKMMKKKLTGQMSLSCQYRTPIVCASGAVLMRRQYVDAVSYAAAWYTWVR